MLLGFLDPSRGSSTVLGHDSRALPPAIRARVGYMAEGHPVYGWMSIAESGRFQRSFYPRWEQRVFDAVIEHFDIDPAAKAKSLSRGQRAGLCLALTLAPRPDVLVLDDPALGLDPVARQSLLEAIIYFTREEGRTILFSSHILADVERVADRIAVIQSGVLRACSTLDGFRERVRKVVLHHREAPPSLPRIPGLLSTERKGGQTVLKIVDLDEEGRSRLASCGAASLEEVSMGFEEALISYLGERGERGFFLSREGEPS
jgi:ABC-2 type transport system ATP-binding protein